MLSFFAMVATETTAQTESVTVTSVGYATFSSGNHLDFTSAVKIKAYTAKISGSYVNFTRIYQVPAGTGVLLWASGGATEDIPVIASANPVDNDFKVAQYDMNKAELNDEGQAYVLGNHKDYGIGFYQPAEGFVLPKGKCYLQIVKGNSAKFIGFHFEGEATGIAGLESANDKLQGTIYNLAGQRVTTPAHGLYIVNGKKVFIK